MNAQPLLNRLQLLNREPWAIDPDWFAWALGASDTEIEARVGVKPTRSVTGKIAILPVYGVILQRSESPWEVSTEELGTAIDQLVARPDVDSIVLDINSPGGTVSGVPELGEKIYAARQEKKVVAVANSMAASAAYWLGSAAQEFIVIPSGAAGSIGVWNMHVDVSKALESFGVKPTLISAGKYKVEGNPIEPLGEEARGEMQRVVDEYYEMFVGAVARNRNVTTAAVRGGFGEGRTLTASRAVEAGLVDRAATMQTVLSRLGASLPGSQSNKQRAEVLRRKIDLTSIG